MAKKNRGKKLARAPKRKGKPNKKRSHKDSLSLGGDIWPLEKDILFRPDRFKYVRKLIKPEGCVFCKAAEEPPGYETLCLLKTEHSQILLNKFPYNSGHILVLPLRHCGDMLELSEKEYIDLQMTVLLAMQAVRSVYQPAGLNLGLNHGAVAGAGIPDHLHYHLIPRWAGDLNFFPLIAETKTVIESLDMTYDKLLTYFKDHPKRKL